MFGWTRYTDAICVAAEPTVESLYTTQRLLNLSKARWAPATLAVVADNVSEHPVTWPVSGEFPPTIATSASATRSASRGASSR